MRQGLQADRRDALQVCAVFHVVHVALGLIAARQNRIVVQDLQQWHIRLCLRGSQHGPAHGPGAFAVEPRFELPFQVLAPAVCDGAFVFHLLSQAQTQPTDGVLRAVLLIELDRPARAAGEAGWFLQRERGGPVDVPLARTLNRPTRLRIAVDGVGDGKAVLREVRIGASDLDRLARPLAVAPSGRNGDFIENEIAVRRPARPGARQFRIGQRFETKRGYVGQVTINDQRVRVLVRVLSGEPDRAVVLLFGRRAARGNRTRRPRDRPTKLPFRREPVRQVIGDRPNLCLNLGPPPGDLRIGHWHRRLVRVVQAGHYLVVFAVRDRVVLVSVALGAHQGQAEPGRSRGADAVGHGMKAELQRIDPALFVEHRVAVEAGGDPLIGRGVRQHVAGDLFDRELIERQVFVERVDHPVAERPHRPRAVLLVAVGVRVPGQVEPAAGPALAVVRRCQQSIDQLRIGVG